MEKIKLVCVVGATASGKTGLAVKLCQDFNGEIISADSRQVYKGMDLGTGKEGEAVIIDLSEAGAQPARIVDGIPQFGVDLLEPMQRFTAADFKELANRLIPNIIDRGKQPFITGGTHLYIQALTDNFTLAETDEEELALRGELEQLEIEELLEKLEKADIATFEKIDKNNKRRIVRALAASLHFGKPFSQQKTTTESQYKVLNIALEMPREKLYERIDKRVDDRIKAGMLEEVKGLLDCGIPPERLIDFGLEYKFITYYYLSQMTKEEMIQKLKFATHAFARRQLTWMRTQMNVKWVKNYSQAKELVEKFLD